MLGDTGTGLTESGGSREKLKLAFSLLATMRGIPQLYAGDEIGMGGGEDPDNRRDFPGGFPGDSNNAFTRTGRTPEQQDIFARVQTLLKLRQQHPALRTGVQKHVAVADKYYVFTRETSGERLLVVFQNGDAPQDVTLELGGTSISDATGVSSIFGPSAAQVEDGKLTIHLAPRSLTIYSVQ